MSFLTGWFPAACSRLKIFICYGHNDRSLAREIAQTLTNDGHDVFVDANSLKAGADFHEAIRDFIGRADRFVFLASKHSLSPEAYPQTELGFAQERWPAPKGAVWPVIVEPGVDPQTLPVYLRSVQAFTPKGNLVADIASAIAKSKAVRPWCWACTVLATLLAAGLVAAVAVPGMLGGTVELTGLKQADFRPQIAPEDETPWRDAPAMLTLKTVGYSNNTGDRVIVKGEAAKLTLGDRIVTYTGYNEVDMKEDCGNVWLCTKGSLKPLTLEPRAGSGRETMYEPAKGSKLSWRDFIDTLCKSSADTFDITLSPEIQHSGFVRIVAASQTCRIDLKEQRAQLQATACSEANKLPFWITTRCQ